jgi:hypothetical protein
VAEDEFAFETIDEEEPLLLLLATVVEFWWLLKELLFRFEFAEVVVVVGAERSLFAFPSSNASSFSIADESSKSCKSSSVDLIRTCWLLESARTSLALFC